MGELNMIMAGNNVLSQYIKNKNGLLTLYIASFNNLLHTTSLSLDGTRLYIVQSVFLL